MFVGRNSELDTIRDHLAAQRTSPESTAVIAVYGLFGAGKTTLLSKIRSQIESEALAEALFFSNEDIATTTLPEFVFDLADSFRSLNPGFPRFYIEETEMRRRRYLQIIGKLGADTMPILQKLRSEERSHETLEAEQKQQISNDLLALEYAIKNQFNNPDDQRLILDTGNVLAESLIVDMINTFFPLTSKIASLDYYLKKKLAPKKVVILIDTFEKVSPLVNPWLLESFLPYLLQKRFGDFRSYRTPELPDITHVRDFLDVRFVIAGRERLMLTDQERRWDRYREKTLEVGLNSFTGNELKEYLNLNGITSEAEAKRVMEMTQGLPYLVALWVDATKAHSGGAESAFVSALAEQRIFWYKTPQQQEWIRAAAFLDWFDADALRCFPTVNEDAEAAYEYLRTSSEIAKPSLGKPGKFEVHGIIRSALRDSTSQQSGERATEFNEAAAAFYESSTLLARFDADQRRMLRRLAYFERFDDQALEGLFGGEAHYARALVRSSGDLFNRHKYTISFKRDPALKLHRYNRCADRKVYTKRLDQAKQLWENRRANLRERISVCRDEIARAEERLRGFGIEQNMKTELQGQIRQTLNAMKSELTLAKRRWVWQLSDREVLVARSSFFFLVLFLLGIFTAKLLPVPEDTQNVIRTASLAMAALFLGVFALMLGRILYYRGRRAEQQALREDVVSVEDRLRDKQYEFYNLAAEAEGAAAEIEALSGQIQRLNAEIAECEKRLSEPYV